MKKKIDGVLTTTGPLEGLMSPSDMAFSLQARIQVKYPGKPKKQWRMRRTGRKGDDEKWVGSCLI